MAKRIIVALDFATAEQALEFVARLSPGSCRLKVGFELFVAAGPDFVRKLVGMGFDVFLDLKFHDIPNTVAAACQAAAKLGVWMLNVHASGSHVMLERAVEAVQAAEKPPLLIGVTVLTSMDREQLVGIGLNREPIEQVGRLAMLCKENGLDGVVCSAREAATLKQQCGNDFALVTPGIRPVDAAADDQSRVMTPLQAIQAGADYLVIGRPVTQASDPVAVISRINQEIA